MQPIISGIAGLGKGGWGMSTTIPLRLLTQPVDIIHFTPGARDAFGNRSRIAQDPVSVRGRLQQMESKEQTAVGDLVSDRWLLILSADVTIGAGDEVVDGERRFQVDGTPAVLWDATTPHHIEARLLYIGDVT